MTIHVQDLVKAFGRRRALNGVALSIAAGECVTLVGHNGAGKTTLLRILAALTRPTSGTVRVAGLDPSRDGVALRRQVGFFSHQTLLYDDLTAVENLHFYARMYDLNRASWRVDELIEQVGLDARRDDLVRQLSRGMQQRLALARAILHRPSVLLLDEPFTGLDLQAARTLTDLLAQWMERAGTVLIATHDLERGLTLGQRVLILNQGRFVYAAPCQEIDLPAFLETCRTLMAGRAGGMR